MNYVLGIDLGTSGVKCIILSENGDIVASKSRSYTPDFYSGGRVEQHPSVWWDNTVSVIKELLSEQTAIRDSIIAVSCAGQMHSSVFLDDCGDVIRPAILWNDTRTTEETKDIINALGSEKALLAEVQNKALEGFTLPKILWLRKNEPQNFQRVNKVILPKDYINFMLTDKARITTDYSDASGVLLFDVVKRRWNTTVLDKLGLSADILPEVLESTDIIGEVPKSISEMTGLPIGTKVIPGGADNSCAAIGNGVVKEGQGVVSVGTSGTVIGFVGNVKPETEITGAVHLFNYSYPDSNYAMGVMLSAGECLGWLKRDILKDSVISFDELNALAETAAPGSGKLIFLPYLFGERCPYSDADARGIFFGLSGTTRTNELVRSVMEGVAYGLRDLYGLVEGFAPLDEILVTGGGAKSPVWGGIIADILNRPITIINVEEGPALGAAFIAGVGSGMFESFGDAVSKSIKVQRVIEPNPNNAALYDEYYKVYKKLYADNYSNFKALAAL